jgi:hypothetical protein
MQLKRLSLVTSGFCLMFISAADAQPEFVHPLAENTAKMVITIKMDRDVYFQGEFYQATIEALNPTSTPLLVEAPFGRAGCLVLLRKEGDTLVPTVDPRRSDGGCRDQALRQATTLSPGERRRVTLNPWGFNDGPWPRLTGGNGMRLEPGTYVLQYSYGAGGEAQFTVVAPKLEAVAAARANDEMYSDRPDEQDPQPHPAYVWIVSFRWQGLSYICVSQSFASSPVRNPALKPGGPDASGLTTFKRVATVQEPVVSLSATADAEENLRIEWTTASGRQDSLLYLASYVGRDAHERDRKRMLEELEKAADKDQ